MVMILWLIEKNVLNVVRAIVIVKKCFVHILESMVMMEKPNGLLKVGFAINATMLFLIDFFYLIFLHNTQARNS